jgi:hypothetical protein
VQKRSIIDEYGLGRTHLREFARMKKRFPVSEHHIGVLGIKWPAFGPIPSLD